MKNFKPGISLFFYAVLLLVTCATCKKKDDDDGFTIKAGDWTGTDIAFVVGGDPRKITSMEFTYSGHASGSSCSFDYETTVSFGFDVDIEDNSFSLSLSDYEINGTFISASNAEIDIEWAVYDAYCDASYSGSRTYNASYGTRKKSAAGYTNDKNTEIVEFEKDNCKTRIVKKY